MKSEIYIELFNELVERFESEETTYDQFIEALSSCNQAAIESIGEDVFNSRLNVRRDYVELKKFNRNKNQIALF